MLRYIAPIIVVISILFSVMFLSNTLVPCFAQEDSLIELKQQIESLQKRIDVLESEKKNRTGQNTAVPVGFFQKRSRARWDPFEEMAQMQQEMNQMFKNSFNWGGLSSKGMYSSDVFYDDKFDMREEKDKYIVEFDMTGFNKSKINIQVNERSLTVKGESSEDKKKDQKNRYFSSQSYASFMRTIVIPDDADVSRMKSENKGDKLIITFPKKKV